MDTALRKVSSLAAANHVGCPVGDAACGLAIAIVSAFCDQPEEGIACSARCSAATSEARHIAIYLAHVVFQRPRRVIAETFRRDRTSVAHALRRVEDRRDDASFDALLARMEHVAQRCRALMPEPAGQGR